MPLPFPIVSLLFFFSCFISILFTFLLKNICVLCLGQFTPEFFKLSWSLLGNFSSDLLKVVQLLYTLPPNLNLNMTFHFPMSLLFAFPCLHRV